MVRYKPLRRGVVSLFRNPVPETQSSRMETEGYPETEENREEVKNIQIRSLPDEMMAGKPEVVLIPAPRVQVPVESAELPPESLHECALEDLEFIPQRNPPNPAASQQRFRQFRYEDAAGPRDVLRHLQELARQWLRPDIHTKEQIVEVLVQEQFQAVLPEELRARVQRCQPGVRITG
ncbi:SCAN domain-containing protein 1-like [Choloepus didactylus]|uniref:SCAN domain-containing protein 1-like n=1 Tax=Choloepus didactylus TaxID=27675 RepID=UPI00189D462C|nr:SCAN domain-containing protein 1-like [Choloepus didactylus]